MTFPQIQWAICASDSTFPNRHKLYLSLQLDSTTFCLTDLENRLFAFPCATAKTEHNLQITYVAKNVNLPECNYKCSSYISQVLAFVLVGLQR